MSEFNNLVKRLKEKDHRRIYLSHEPWQEQEARDLARRLTEKGFTIIIGVDARPHKDRPHDEDDLDVVRKTIDSCDAVVVYKRWKKRFLYMEG